MLTSLATGVRQDAVDPALRAAVDRYFATQQSEDVDGYLGLWSAAATRPTREQLKYVFDSGDDVFSGIAIVRATAAGDDVRVRVSATRDRVENNPAPGGAAVRRRSSVLVSLTFRREGADWKLLREAPAVDDLAAALLEARSPEEREELLKGEDAAVLNNSLIAALSRRGGAAAQRQMFGAAQTAYERMLEIARRIDNPLAEGEALQNLGNALYFQRAFGRALDAYTERLALERRRGNDGGVAAALTGIGTIQYSTAEYGPALASYREALAIQERLIDEPGAATTLISTGNVLYLQGDYDAAIRDYRRSRDLQRKVANPLGEASALEGLARVLVAQGDFVAALQALAGVLAEAQARHDRGRQGIASMSVGEVHFRLGNLDAARTSFDESRKAFEAAGNLANTGHVWQNLALTDLVAGSFGRAEQEYAQSTANCTSAGDAECVAAATVGLAFAQAAQGKYPDAIASYRKGIAQFTALRRAEQTARAQIGLSLALSGNENYADAITVAADVRRSAIALHNDDVLWRAFVAEARALRRSGAREQALSVARAAVYPVERLEENARARPGNHLSRDSSAVFAILAILQAESGDAAGAFASAERLRVHDLRAVLGAHEREIARGMTPAERDTERALAVELVSLDAQLTREKSLPKPDASRIQTLGSRITEASSRRAAQQQQLFERLPDLPLWRGLMTPAVAADLDTLLDRSDTLLLEFVITDENVLAISAWRGESSVELKAEIASIPRRTLADRVAELVRPDTLRDVARWKQAAAAFVRSVPLSPRLASAKRVIVVPHEILWRVPFEALPIGDRYFGDGRLVSYAPSVTAIVRTPAPPLSEAKQTLALGAPAIGSALRDRVAQTMPGWTLRAPESAEREALGIAKDAGEEATVLLGSAATETAVRDKVSHAGYVHLGAPFRVNRASPLFSPILLASSVPPAESSSTDDGVLELREIFNVDVPARAVVFSDGAALGMRDAAEDAAIVYWGWRAAGASAVVLPRWTADETSARFSIELARDIRAGSAPDAALQAVRTRIRTAAARSEPLYWAGWLVVMGR